MVSFICVHWGRDTFLRNKFSSPAETEISEGTQVRITGQVCQIEQVSDYQVVYLKNNSIQKNQKDNSQNKEIHEPYLFVYDDSRQKLQLGNIVQVSGRIQFLEDARNPGGFSQKAYYRSRKISAYLWSSKIQCLDKTTYRCRDFLNRLRLRWKTLLMDAAGEEYGGVLCAVILGDKRQMDTEIKELYQVNGIAHILAKKCTNEYICV